MFGNLNGTTLDRLQLISQNGSDLLSVEMFQCGESEGVYKNARTFILPSTPFYIVSAFSQKPITKTWRL